MTGLPMTMAGMDRQYSLPRAVRRMATASHGDNALMGRVLTGTVTAWDLLALEQQPEMNEWAGQTLDTLVATADAVGTAALGCTDCADIGFYGVPDGSDDDLLVGLVRRGSVTGYETLTAAGEWMPWVPTRTLEVLSLDLAGDLAAAITGGACGLLRRYAWPRAFLPPCAVIAATPIHDALTSLLSAETFVTPHGEWVNFAVVDEADPGAVLELLRVRESSTTFERYEDGSWLPESELTGQSEVPAVVLDETQYTDVMAQLAASLVADAPLTVSPNPKAEKLRRYWSTGGRGGAKIRWIAPGNGDFNRCYRHLQKYMGVRARGYCANLHKRNTGVWPGSHLNTGKRLRSALASLSPEESLLASVRTGQWGRDKERKSEMPLEMELLTDGIYVEGSDENAGILQTITAGGFPVAPPDEWYKNPNLTGPTPMEITDKGQVYGHLATWDVTHVGMRAATHAPHSASDYAYFLTGALKLESGKQVNVGQITLAGGHADINGNAQAAVQHYDDTNSAICDVTCGEDAYGIWAAGSLRPGVTPEQIRVFRASPPSGDWRPINGHLEMVAACSVNVPGFMNVRPTARVAGGAVLALVAAGTAELTRIRAAAAADASLVDRLAALEKRILDLENEEKNEPVEPSEAPPMAAAADAPAESPPASEVQATGDAVAPTGEAEESVPELTAEEAARAAKISRTRQDIADIKRQLLRDKVHATTAAMPPQFLKNAEKNKGKSTIPGTDSYPIGNVADLKKAIQAFGRAKDPAAAKKHIITQAKKLGRADLIPDNWNAK